MLGVLALLLAGTAQTQAQDGASVVELGKALFFDPALSVNGTQSCATCHGPEAGFTGPDSAANAGGAVYHGALGDRFGNRKPPTAAYAGYSPVLHQVGEAGEWVGGMFWDGRATGSTLGDPLAEQAQGPFLNPLEQGMPNARLLAIRVANADYADLFEEVWGPGSLNFVDDVTGTFEKIARSIAAYEKSSEVNPYTSKFDFFWDNATAAGKDVTKIKMGGGMGGGGMGGGGMGGGQDPNRWQTYRNLGLTDTELQGLASFNDPGRADCASCHTLTPGPDGYPLFTDFGYANIGVPKNPANPFYAMPKKWNPSGTGWVDEGLGAALKSAGAVGGGLRTGARQVQGSHPPECRSATLRGLREGVRAQRVFQVARRGRHLLPLARHDGRRDVRRHGRRRHGRRRHGRRRYGMRGHGHDVPGTGSRPEPGDAEDVPRHGSREHRRLPQDAFGWLRPAVASYQLTESLGDLRKEEKASPRASGSRRPDAGATVDCACRSARQAEITLRMISASFSRASGRTTPAASSWAMASSRQRRASARV